VRVRHGPAAVTAVSAEVRLPAGREEQPPSEERGTLSHGKWDAFGSASPRSSRRVHILLSANLLDIHAGYKQLNRKESHVDRKFKLPKVPLRKNAPSRAKALVVLTLAALLLATGALLSACGSQEETTTTVKVQEEASTTTTVVETEDTQPEEEAVFPVTVTDDNGTEVTIEQLPTRIVSTSPANTEILFALGVGDRVVGVTSLCDYPAEAVEIEKIGDFQANTEKVIARDPDLVVGYAGNEEALSPVSEAGIPVIIMNPSSLEGVYTDIETIGTTVGAPAAATELITSMRVEIEGTANTAAETGESPTVFYTLDSTLWTAGPGSFVDELLALAGGNNIASDGPSPYFQYTPEEVVEKNPEIVLLPQSTFQSADEFTGDSRFAELQAVKDGNVHVVDDTTVTRPGPRLPQGIKILARALHPDAFK